MRSNLIEKLENYIGTEEENRCIKPIMHLLQKQDCFYRTCFIPGHITGSAILCNQTMDKILLNHHKIFNKWLCFGGHADGDENIKNVALRETIEESGYSENEIEFAISDIFDIDIHLIAENKGKNEPEHSHFDFVFLLQLKEKTSLDFKVSEESIDLKWCTLTEALELVRDDQRMIRIIHKLKTLTK
ncbi:MAG: NUDIX hydrolase [Pseudobdellovibrionaceae bacterium]|jgi:8-oxo-dGTP pyrophosphatase MutT (NUDIX family)|nr:NUDIX hydrolase [Pseudobdellovibrionaceae bacterium]